MSAGRDPDTTKYDLFKAAVALVLCVVLALLVWRTHSTPAVQATLQAPAIPVLGSSQLTAGGSLSLSGTGEPGSVVELWTGDVKLGAATVKDDGTWSVQAHLEPGDHVLTARTVDVGGKVLNESQTLTLNVPSPPSEIVALEMQTPDVSTDGGISLSGTGEAGAEVELWAGDARLATVTVRDDGTWSFQGNVEPGDCVLVARTVDADGTILDESQALALNVPSPPSEIFALEMQTPDVGTDGGISLSGTGEAGAEVELWAGEVRLGAATVRDDGTWSFQGNIEPGDYVLVARTVGVDGIVLSESSAHEVLVPPSLVRSPPTLGEPEAGAAGKITLVGTGEPGETLDVVENGVLIGTTTASANGSWEFAYEGVPGEHEVVVRYADQPSTVSVAATVRVTVDKDKPVGPEPASTDRTGGQAYIVQSGDWLVELARTHLGSGELFPLIIHATNAKAAEDPSFASILYPNYIRPGWKIWIPNP